MINDSLKPEPDYKREGCQQCNKCCGTGALILAGCFLELIALNNDYSTSVYVRFKAVACLLFQHFGFWGPYCSTSNSKLGLWYIPRCYYWGSGPFLGHTVCKSSVSINFTGINIRLQYIEQCWGASVCSTSAAFDPRGHPRCEYIRPSMPPVSTKPLELHSHRPSCCY